MKKQFIKILLKWEYRPSYSGNIYIHSQLPSINITEVSTLEDLMRSMWHAGKENTQNEVKKSLGL